MEPTEDHPEDWPLAQIRQQHVVANGMFARVTMQHAGAGRFGRLACVDGVIDESFDRRFVTARAQCWIHGPGMPHAQLTSRFGDWPVSEVQPIVLEPGGLHAVSLTSSAIFHQARVCRWPYILNRRALSRSM